MNQPPQAGSACSTPFSPRRSAAPVPFGRAGKTPDDVQTQDVFAWAYGVGLSGRQPSSITIGARLACASSFFRFLIRMKIVSSNPCDPLERPKALPGAPRG